MGLLDSLFDPGSKDRKLARKAAEAGVIENVGVTGPLGGRTLFSNGNLSSGLSLDDRRLAQLFSERALDSAGGPAGLPEFFQDAASSATGALGDPGLDTSGFDPSLLQAFQGGIASQLPALFANPAELGADTLSLLREQAAPGERRAALRLNDELFKTGRRGTTGGGQDISAFSRGLEEADVAREMAALQAGMQQQQGARSTLSSLFGAGSSMINQGFGRELSAQQLAGQRARDRFGIAQSMLSSMFGQQDRALNEAATFTGLRGNLQNQALAPFMAALQAEVARSNSQFNLAGTHQQNAAMATSPLLEAFNAAGSFMNASGLQFGQ